MSEETRIEEGQEVQGLDLSRFRLTAVPSANPLPRPEGHEPYDIISKKFPATQPPSTGAPVPNTGDPAYDALVQALVASLTRMIRGQVAMIPAIVQVNSTAPIQVLPVQPDRNYLIVANPDPVATLRLGVGYQPTVATGLPILANGSYEPGRVPDNELFVLSSAASSVVVVLYAIGNML